MFCWLLWWFHQHSFSIVGCWAVWRQSRTCLQRYILFVLFCPCRSRWEGSPWTIYSWYRTQKGWISYTKIQLICRGCRGPLALRVDLPWGTTDSTCTLSDYIMSINTYAVACVYGIWWSTDEYFHDFHNGPVFLAAWHREQCQMTCCNPTSQG